MIDLKKVAAVRDAIEQARGPLFFFAAFLIAETDQWDIVVAGPNLREDDFDDLKAASAELVRVLAPSDLRDIRRVVVFDPEFEPLQELLAEELDLDEPVVKTNFAFSRLVIERAYIFTAHRPQFLAAAR
jgi:hypothetical protein